MVVRQIVVKFKGLPEREWLRIANIHGVVHRARLLIVALVNRLRRDASQRIFRNNAGRQARRRSIELVDRHVRAPIVLIIARHIPAYRKRPSFLPKLTEQQQ